MEPVNWADERFGARLVDFSSEVEGCEAQNVLTGKDSKIWLTEEGLPQWLCISLADLENRRSLVIRSIGWYCWHQYSTNPKSVTIHVSSDGSKFKHWDTFTVSVSSQTQLFCCAPINLSIFPFIALEITQTFGGAQTYLNRVYFFSDEIEINSSIMGIDKSLDSLNLRARSTDQTSESVLRSTDIDYLLTSAHRIQPLVQSRHSTSSEDAGSSNSERHRAGLERALRQKQYQYFSDLLNGNPRSRPPEVSEDMVAIFQNIVGLFHDRNRNR